MSEAFHRAGIRGIHHVHRQLKAVCTLVQPEYRPVFDKIIKVMELQLILQELSQDAPKQFQASSVSSGEQSYEPCDLTTFVQAVAPVCNEAELSFLHNLQNVEQSIRMFEQMKQFQNLSESTRPEDFMMQFMNPGQQKIFKQFDEFYSKQVQNNQEVPYGSNESSFFTGDYESGKNH
ncbi:MAG: hypothetical protein Q4F21_09755 [Lachnospiraceae bacterium]|nr:hypothetical protein [Lachnospiraceae bacterium]